MTERIRGGLRNALYKQTYTLLLVKQLLLTDLDQTYSAINHCMNIYRNMPCITRML